jgi:hypothetical protein
MRSHQSNGRGVHGFSGGFIKVSTLQKRAMSALKRALKSIRPELPLTPNGYVNHWRDNLLPGTDPQWFEAELREGAGKELDSKFRAAHSSSALAINTFAQFKTEPNMLSLANWSGCCCFRFEAKCSAGIIGRRGLDSPPHLDVLARCATSVLGIESKCTEHLKSRALKFSPAYSDQIKDDARRNSAWFESMQKIRMTDYCHLDAAQLIKHAFGLAHCFPSRDVTLLYLYWEPSNAAEFSECKNHREEVQRFAKEVKGASPSFRHLSYQELWREWSLLSSPTWLSEHLTALRERYDICV